MVVLTGAGQLGLPGGKKAVEGSAYQELGPSRTCSTVREGTNSRDVRENTLSFTFLQHASFSSLPLTALAGGLRNMFCRSQLLMMQSRAEIGNGWETQ